MGKKLKKEKGRESRLCITLLETNGFWEPFVKPLVFFFITKQQ